MDILNFYFRSPFHMVRILLAGVLIVITTIGCASKGPLSETEKLDYKGRVVTSSDGAVLVSASVQITCGLSGLLNAITGYKSRKKPPGGEGLPQEALFLIKQNPTDAWA